MERPRKAPAVERSVLEITEEDIKVRVLGRVAEREADYLVLEDETGKLRVNTSEELETGSLVRVFGRPLKNDTGFAVEAELIQNMSGLDEKLYKKWMLLKKK